MDPIRTLHPLARAWLLDGPLSSHVDAYVALLERGRYAEGSIEKPLRALAHFAHWMSMCRLPARILDEGCIDQFLRLPPAALRLPGRCAAHAGDLQCRPWTPAGDPAAAARHRANGRRPPAPLPRSCAATTRTCATHEAWRPARVSGRLRIVGRLLLCKFAGRAFTVGELQPEDVRSFIAQS